MSMATGAVAVAGTWLNTGARNRDAKNRTPVVIAATPVRPPSSMPAADSTYTMTGEEPVSAPTTVPTPQPMNA